MATLKSALVARFVSVAGGTPPLYFDEAPEDADPGKAPYIVYLLIEAAPTLTTGDVTMQAIEAQFSAFGPSAGAVEAIGALLRQAFDPARLRPRLAWDDGYEMTIAPLGGRTIRERRTTTLPDRGPGGAAVWHRLERFQVLVATTLGGGDPFSGVDPSSGMIDPDDFGATRFDAGGFDDPFDDPTVPAPTPYDSTSPSYGAGSTSPPAAGFSSAGFDEGGFDDPSPAAIGTPATAPAPLGVPAFDGGGFDDSTFDA
jgi:hypothetical protein